MTTVERALSARDGPVHVLLHDGEEEARVHFNALALHRADPTHQWFSVRAWRARVRATVSRRASAQKPSSPPVRTAHTTTASASLPWKESTVETRTPSGGASASTASRIAT